MARVEELRDSYQQRLLSTSDMAEVFRLQGRVATLSEIMGLARDMVRQGTTGELV